MDIFFVISGFLITSILQEDLGARGEGFLRFYERRVERLFPALIAVCVVVSTAGCLLLFPPELADLGKHLIGCLTFTSNFTLWNEAGYFDADALLKPLRMLWSLAVEEQFYLLWPVSFWCLVKRRNPRLTPIAVLALSFAVCLFHSASDGAAAYYSPASRIWEPLLGCLLAMRQPSGTATIAPLTKIGHTNFWSIAGVLLIFAAIFAIPSSAAYPGFWALLPTVGAALLIAAGPESSTAVLLASRPFTWLGCISYPFYLWHWPILSFMRIVYGAEPTAFSRVAAVVVAVLLALATYIFIERPVRQNRSLKTAAVLVGLFAVSAGASGYVFIESAGLPNRSILKKALPGQIGVRALDEYFEAVYSEFGPCSPGRLRDEAPRYHTYIRCFESKPGQPIDVAIIGDSHAENLFLGIAEALPKKNVAMYMHGAIPLSNDSAFDHIYQDVAENKSIKSVIVASFWTPKNLRNIYPSDLDTSIAETVRPLLSAGKYVYLTDDTPNFSFDASHCKYRRVIEWGHDRCDEDAGIFTSQQVAYLPAFQRAESQLANLHILRISDFFCDEKTCRMQRNGVILFRDRDHLNVQGSRALGIRVISTHPELSK